METREAHRTCCSETRTPKSALVSQRSAQSFVQAISIPNLLRGWSERRRLRWIRAIDAHTRGRFSRAPDCYELIVRLTFIASAAARPRLHAAASGTPLA